MNGFCVLYFNFHNDNRPGMKVLNLSTINQNILKTHYAVRGELPIRATQLKKELEEGKKLPFKKIIQCNIGNPQELGQQPTTFYRQVCSLLEAPKADFAKLAQVFPADVVKRANEISEICPSIGAYSPSNGLEYVRKAVTRFIEERDGFPSDSDQIYLTNGASEGIFRLLNAIIAHPKVGVFLPIPQYPLYSATLSMLDGQTIPYELDEKRGWALDLQNLKTAMKKAKKHGTDVRAFVMINPGNPTGQVFSREDLHEIIRFCRDERLVLLADEVYQENIYYPEQEPFLSVKRVLMEMGPEFSQQVELVSFHSTSKGLIGECGHRGGYFECHNLDRQVQTQLFKVASVSLCSNVMGQVMVSLMVNPPQPGDESFALYEKERDDLFMSLKRRNEMLHELFNSLEGVSCQRASGALYLFPRFEFSPSVHEAARKAGKNVDTFYALDLLNATGVCVVPGSGFGQAEGSHHLRFTFLPKEEEFSDFCSLIRAFHTDFLAKYSQ